MKPIKPVKIPMTLKDLIHPDASAQLEHANTRLNALSNMKVQILMKDASGNPRVGVGQVQILGDSSILQITL